jgi:hypothetical protein
MTDLKQLEKDKSLFVDNIIDEIERITRELNQYSDIPSISTYYFHIKEDGTIMILDFDYENGKFTIDEFKEDLLTFKPEKLQGVLDKLIKAYEKTQSEIQEYKNNEILKQYLKQLRVMNFK